MVSNDLLLKFFRKETQKNTIFEAIYFNILLYHLQDLTLNQWFLDLLYSLVTHLRVRVLREGLKKIVFAFNSLITIMVVWLKEPWK